LILFFDFGDFGLEYGGILLGQGDIRLYSYALGLQKLYLKDQPRFKRQGDVIG